MVEQDIPARDELLVHHSASLLLPPQLRLLLPHHHGDASTMPLCVQLNHVFCHQNGEYSILAMAHRFRDRSVTQLLYKPTHVPPRERGSGLFTISVHGTGMHAADQVSEGRGLPRDATAACKRSPRRPAPLFTGQRGARASHVTDRHRAACDLEGRGTPLSAHRGYPASARGRSWS